MKKRLIFCFFALILSFCTLLFPKTAHAEIEGYTVNILSKVCNSSDGIYEDTDCYNQVTATFGADYSQFTEHGSILFSAQLEKSETVEAGEFTYEWKTSAGATLSNSPELILYKNTSNIYQPLILIGETKYALTVTNTLTNQSVQKVITVRITDNQSQCDLITFFPTVPVEITNSSETFEFVAKLPIVNGSTINWYLKTPNSVDYNLITTQSETYTFNPSETINSQNGYGIYRVMAIGHNKNTKKYYYSETFEIKAVESAQVLILSNYSINTKMIDNTRAKIEAFEYTLEGAESLNFDNIYWYINDTRVSSGETFIYEPTDTSAYKVFAKYKKADGTIAVLGELRQEPHATGTEILVLYVLAGVAVISIIFTISIIVTNKKRDVVW